MVRDFSAVLACAALLSACTVTDTPAPPLRGPSELGLALSILARPALLTQDGTSQSRVEVHAFDENGKPASGVELRAEIVVDGINADFGSLSSRTFRTGADGQAFVMYTAPPAPSINTDLNSKVSVAVTPSGTNYGDSLRRFVDIRLVPPGEVVGIGPSVEFTFTPEAPDILKDVIFNASSPLNANITSYAWDFGDGGVTETTRSTTHVHQFKKPGSYAVKLTVTYSNGLSGSFTRSIAVALGAPPEAVAFASPLAPLPGDTVFFTAEGSRASEGREIVRYAWRFGDGATASGRTTSHRFKEIGTYTVVLTVTDDAGQQDTINLPVLVGVDPPDPPEEESGADPVVPTTPTP